jgi:glycosyltransferase involved in cell wall biosynthesis
VATEKSIAGVVMSLPVSVYVITLNEAANLRRLLPQLAGFSEVVIVDSGSNDGTQDVARSFANVKLFHRDWSGFSDQKNYALSLCAQEWVLNLDADEELTDDYLAELRGVLKSGAYDALRTRRKLLRWGQASRSFYKDDVLVRFFRKRCGYYPSARVHEKLEIQGRVCDSNVYFLHHENLTFTQRIHKSNQYSELKALDKFAQGKRANVLQLALIFPLRLVQAYLGKGCFLDGMDGVLTSMNVAWYHFMQYAKLWELEKLQRQRRQDELERPVGTATEPAPATLLPTR